jgi:hypothetical protein
VATSAAPATSLKSLVRIEIFSCLFTPPEIQPASSAASIPKKPVFATVSGLIKSL